MLQTQVRARSASSSTSSWCFECNAQTPRANFDTVFGRAGYSECLLGDAEEAEAEVCTDAAEAVDCPACCCVYRDRNLTIAPICGLPYPRLSQIVVKSPYLRFWHSSRQDKTISSNEPGERSRAAPPKALRSIDSWALGSLPREADRITSVFPRTISSVRPIFFSPGKRVLTRAIVAPCPVCLYPSVRESQRRNLPGTRCAGFDYSQLISDCRSAAMDDAPPEEMQTVVVVGLGMVGIGECDVLRI